MSASAGSAPPVAEADVGPGERPAPSGGRREQDGVTHTIYGSFDEITHRQAAWDSLVEETGGDIYATFDWCRIWWKYYGEGRRLQIHFFEISGVPVAVLPLFHETVGFGPLRARTVRLVGCDSMLAICWCTVRPDCASAVLARVIEHLDRTCSWDLLQFAPLAGYFENARILVEALERCQTIDHVVFSGNAGPHMVMTLPESFDAYLSTLPASERKSLRKREKKLHEAHAVRIAHVDADSLDSEFDALVAQHQQLWQSKGQLGHFTDWPGSSSFHREVAAVQAGHRRLLVLRLEADGEPLAFQYGYRFNRRTHTMHCSRNLEEKWEPFAPGRVLFFATVRDSIQAGDRQIDDMRGMYDYKLRQGAKVLQIQNITAIRRGRLRRLRVSGVRMAAKLLDLGYYRLWFSRIAPRVNVLRRPLWKKWIRSRL